LTPTKFRQLKRIPLKLQISLYTGQNLQQPNFVCVSSHQQRKQGYLI